MKIKLINLIVFHCITLLSTVPHDGCLRTSFLATIVEVWHVRNKLNKILYVPALSEFRLSPWFIKLNIQAACGRTSQQDESRRGGPWFDEPSIFKAAAALLPSVEGTLLVLTFFLTVRCYPLVNKSPSSWEVRKSTHFISQSQ